jgi:5'-3' exonuclease
LKVHLVDGTYELFRHYYAMPPAKDQHGREVAAVRGVVASLLGMISGGATHVGVATDHVIESFRNDLWPGYKTGAGIEPELWAQFPLLEEALAAAGMVVWPMVEFEADDALAAAAVAAAQDARVEQVIICTPDKDLAQTVSGTRIVQLNRRTRAIRDEAGVVAKFGGRRRPFRITSRSGDSADGFPGLAGWGPVGGRGARPFGHIDQIPADWHDWHVNVANPAALGRTLSAERERALLFRHIATLRTDIPLFDSVDALKWKGPTKAFAPLAARLEP